MITIRVIGNVYDSMFSSYPDRIAVGTISGTTKEDIWEKLYKRQCSESYCRQRTNLRPVCAKKEKEWDNWCRTWSSNINNYAKYNRMD
jgi:hypothetical protein